MGSVLRSWKKGQEARHHLWGITEFWRYGIEIKILNFQRYACLNRLGLSPRWGDLDQESRSYFQSGYDVLYSGTNTVVMGLAFLRALGLTRKPIVTLVHHPLPGGRHTRICIRGLDRIIFLSRHVRKKFNTMFPEAASKTSLIEWGPDTIFLKSTSNIGNFLISAGKTLRDYDTLCTALDKAPIQTKIFCSEDSSPQRKIPSCVEVIRGQYAKNPVSYKYVCEAYAQARAVAVPLQKYEMLIGLTSLFDALASGKPVIITRNRCLDIDVEKEGCGFWVEPGDVEGWIKAIRYIIDYPDKAAEMGGRGRKLCETRYNIENFSEKLALILKNTIC